MGKFCSECGSKLNDEGYCPECGNKSETKAEGNVLGKTLDSFTEKINKMTGGEGKVELKIKDLYSEVFKKHEDDEAEDILLSGSAKNAPKPEDISKTWPKPWLYSRVLIVMLLTSVALAVCCNYFNNIYALPCLMAVGSFTVPVSVLVLFFEMNAPRNISFVKAALVFILGGAFSLVVTLFIYSFFNTQQTQTLYAVMVGIIEECGKAAIVAFCLNKMKSCKYILNGLLIGAAVGAGFAAFESTGYAFQCYFNGSYDKMISLICMRGIFELGGHSAWAAISGAAMMIALKGQPFNTKILTDKKFLMLFMFPIALHAVWDMPTFNDLPYNLKYISLIAIVWIILMVLISAGMREINNITLKSESISEE